MPQNDQTSQSNAQAPVSGGSPLYMQSSNKTAAPVADSSTTVMPTPPLGDIITQPSTSPEQSVPQSSEPTVESLSVSPQVEPQPEIVVTPVSSTPDVEAPESAVSNLNVESIISEISEDLNNSLSPGIVVPEKKEEAVAATPEVNKNMLTYNVNAQDTFQDNYQKEIEIPNALKINSSAEGVKEINRVDDDIQAQLVGGMDAAKDLQYKNYTLDEILKEAIKRKASDVHFTFGYRATFRIDGELKTFNSQLLSAQNIKEFAIEIVSNRSDIDLDTIKEVDLTYTLEGKRFRVNIFKQLGVYSIVCRVINETILSLENLGLPPILSSLSKFPNGLIIITGPTGSGKSTTLASLLNTINLSTSKHIVTLEDPVEYVLPKGLSIVDQREFGTDFMSWPNALKSVLRQDPNIVLVGEMRDLDSIEAALQVAETGHLVFATLHTNSAAQSIDRIIDVFPAEKQAQIRLQLASVIRAVTSQRLIPLSAGGRIPVIELVIANTAVQNAIREGKVFLIDNVIQTSAEEGMISLEKSLVQMVKEGKISTQTAKSYSLKPNEIDMLLNK